MEERDNLGTAKNDEVQFVNTTKSGSRTETEAGVWTILILSTLCLSISGSSFVELKCVEWLKI